MFLVNPNDMEPSNGLALDKKCTYLKGNLLSILNMDLPSFILMVARIPPAVPFRVHKFTPAHKKKEAETPVPLPSMNPIVSGGTQKEKLMANSKMPPTVVQATLSFADGLTESCLHAAPSSARSRLAPVTYL